LQHFAVLAAQAPVPHTLLDALLQPLLVLSVQVPFYAATAARARLKKMHEKMSELLLDAT
jgi:nucleolar protein 14